MLFLNCSMRLSEEQIGSLEWAWVIPAPILGPNLEIWYESEDALLMRSEIWHYGMRCSTID